MSAHDANLYEICRLLYDLRNPANREAVRADPRHTTGVTRSASRGMRLLMDRDWQGLVDAGVTVYLLTKLGAALGVSLLEMGAAMRGMSNEEFRRFIEEQNKRNRPLGAAARRDVPGKP